VLKLRINDTKLYPTSHVFMAWCLSKHRDKVFFFFTLCTPSVKSFKLLLVYFCEACCSSIVPSLIQKKTTWLWSASELCRPSDHRLLAK
jgi:hypothetical protein